MLYRVRPGTFRLSFVVFSRLSNDLVDQNRSQGSHREEAEAVLSVVHSSNEGAALAANYPEAGPTLVDPW